MTLAKCHLARVGRCNRLVRIRHGAQYGRRRIGVTMQVVRKGPLGNACSVRPRWLTCISRAGHGSAARHRCRAGLRKHGARSAYSQFPITPTGQTRAAAHALRRIAPKQDGFLALCGLVIAEERTGIAQHGQRAGCHCPDHVKTHHRSGQREQQLDDSLWRFGYYQAKEQPDEHEVDQRALP
jgi:hypothetical protein